MPKTCILDAQRTLEFDEESKSAVIFVAKGSQLTFDPESVAQLHLLLNQKAEHRARSISDYCIATVDNGRLRLISYFHLDCEFSLAATECFKSFLDEMLGPPIDRGEE